jgi:uncharacterized protein YcbX
MSDTAVGTFRSQRRDPHRCAITLVDQETGDRSGPEPLRTLATYRRAAAGGVAFGAKFSVLRPGKLAIGDILTVPTWTESQLDEPRPI